MKHHVSPLLSPPINLWVKWQRFFPWQTVSYHIGLILGAAHYYIDVFLDTLPETNRIAPKKWMVGIQSFPTGEACFEVRTVVSFREGIPKTEIIPIQIPGSRLRFADKTFRTKFSYR